MLLISLYFKGTALCWGPTWISRNFVTDRRQRELWTKCSSLEGSKRRSSSKDSRFALSVATSVSFTLFETFSRFYLMCKNEKNKAPKTTAIGHGRERLERKTSVGLLLLRLCGETIWPTACPRAFLTARLRWPFAKLRAPMQQLHLSTLKVNNDAADLLWQDCVSPCCICMFKVYYRKKKSLGSAVSVSLICPVRCTAAQTPNPPPPVPTTTFFLSLNLINAHFK